MAPHTMDSILQPPQWPAELADFVTWCLMWDPKNRPTSTQALKHPYFVDAIDPLRPKTSSSRLLSSKKSNLSELNRGDSESMPSLTTKTSAWFRKSLARENSAPIMPSQVLPSQPALPSPKPQLVHSQSEQQVPQVPQVPLAPQVPQVQQQAQKPKPNATKRATWNVGLSSNAAPIPILPSIRPISPLVSDGVTVQSTAKPHPQNEEQRAKVGRQLSVASHQNHYPDVARQEAERSLNAGLLSPTSQKESFFSHLRKRARRFSGRYQTPVSPAMEDMEGRQPMAGDPMTGVQGQSEFADLDRALQTVRYSLEAQAQPGAELQVRKPSNRLSINPLMKRQHSVPQGVPSNGASNAAPNSTRTRRQPSQKAGPASQYETPHEEDELLDEALSSVHNAMSTLDRHVQNHQQPHHGHYSYNQGRPQIQQTMTDPTPTAPVASYLMTPSPSANRNVGFGQGVLQSHTKPMDIKKTHSTQPQYTSQWPTPPYEESDWAAAATASIFAAQGHYH